MREKRFITVLGGLIPLLLLISVVIGVASSQSVAVAAEDRGGQALLSHGSATREAELLSRMESDLGGNWHSLKSLDRTSVFAVITGDVRFRSLAGADDKQLTDAATQLVLSYPEVFGLDADQVGPVHVVRAGAKASVLYQQQIDGVSVLGSKIYVIYSDQGVLTGFGGQTYPEITVSTSPSISREAAIAAAQSALVSTLASYEVRESALWIVPGDRQAATADRLVWDLILDQIDTENPQFVRIDAHSGEILEVKAAVMSEQAEGDVKGDVIKTIYCDGIDSDVRFPWERIDVGDNDFGYTDSGGNFSIYYDAGSQPDWSLHTALKGQWADVRNYREPDATYDVPLSPVWNPLYWTEARARKDELNCYIRVNQMHDFMKYIDPSFTLLDFTQVCNVNRVDYYCPGNAWYNWNGAINFCEEEYNPLNLSTYTNTGWLADIIYHEYGHALTYEIYTAYTGSGVLPSIHEANADIVANLITGHPYMALGWILKDPPECEDRYDANRSSENTMLWPDSYNPDHEYQIPHLPGKLLAGVYWEAYADLLNSYSEADAKLISARAWHSGRLLMLPGAGSTEAEISYPEHVLSYFVGDDDDGDLTNGTPHYDSLCVGAMAKGFECPTIPPSVPLVSPENGYSTTDTTPTLDWDPVTGYCDDEGITYTVQVDNDSRFRSVNATATGLTTTIWTVDPALSTTTYYWRVRARNCIGDGPWSDVRSFTIERPSSSPIFRKLNPSNPHQDE